MRYLHVSTRVLEALRNRRRNLLEQIKELQEELERVEATIDRLGSSTEVVQVAVNHRVEGSNPSSPANPR